VTNDEFFNIHAGSACIGLVGSTHFIDKSIRNAQKKLTPDSKASFFSHAFLFSEKRPDDKWWIIESDLEFHRKQVKLGVQENRIDKYFDDDVFPNVAVLNFNLSSHAKREVITEALNLVAGKGKYSLREILGVLISFSKTDRNSENIFSQENSFICSSFVQHCYHKAGIILNKEVSLKHLTPQDIYATPCVHTIEELIREK
jgi:hypothetical protein